MILFTSGLEQDFINFALTPRKIDITPTRVKRLETFARYSVLAFRSNIVRLLTGLGHRDFCARIADSQLLQWFLHVSEVDFIKVFSTSSSDRFGQWVIAEGLRVINQKFRLFAPRLEQTTINHRHLLPALVSPIRSVLIGSFSTVSA